MEGGGPSKFFMGMGDTRNEFSSMVTVASYNPNPLSINQNLNLLSSNNYHRVFSAHPLPPQDQAAGSCYITENSSFSSLMRAKIMSHPHYHRLLGSYLNCQKVGAPLEVVARLEEAAVDSSRSGTSTSCSIGEDPSLDQFMEAYCEMLIKYEQELTKPFKEAMCFLAMVESQIKALTLDSSNHYSAGQNGSSDEVAANENYIDPLAEGRELKGQLLRKYGGYLSTLKLEFLKKKKKGKLPKEARQQLLDWWSRHTRWPYPSESQKLALGESTGLEQKQINNWFINQRKRHWKPSDDVQFLVDDVTHPHYCMDDITSNPYIMDCTPTHFR